MEEIVATVAIPARRASEFRMLSGETPDVSVLSFKLVDDERELQWLAAVAPESFVLDGCETSAVGWKSYRWSSSL